MSHPILQYFATRPDEGGSIHTLGHIASNFDVYRTVAITGVENRPEAWCFTDTASSGALGRLIDGPIIARSDIEKAESALRAILLHDFVDIIVPCAKAIYDTGFLGYSRFDQEQRNNAAFAGMAVAPCRDLLMAFELIHVKHGEIVESTNRSSGLIGAALDDDAVNYQKLIGACSEVAAALPMQLGAAAYFAVPEFEAELKPSPAGFIDTLYKRIYKPWIDIAQSEPALFIDLKLPPFVSIILSRAGHRENIPEVLTDLRDELQEVREDLKRLNRMLDGSTTQAEIHAQVRRVNESFDAIVPEALLTDGERRRRRILSVFRFVQPMRQLYSVAVDPLAADPDRFVELFQSTRSAVINNQHIVSRSVSAAKFAELLRVDSVRDMLTSHFSPEELQILRRD